jgi:hypothetical protein
MKTFFVSAYSQGNKLDSGIAIEGVESVKSILENSFDSIHVYSLSELCMIDNKYIDLTRDYSVDRYIIDNFTSEINFNKSWMRVGFMMWKPRLIYDCMCNNAAFNDIVIYHDLNFNKYPNYLYNFKKINFFYKNIFVKESQTDIIICRDTVKTLSEDVKMFLLDKYLGSNHESIRRLPGFWIGSCAFKKTDYSMDFLEKWITLTESLENSSPFPDINKQYKVNNFCWHAPEQATISVLYYSNLINCKNKIKIIFTPNRLLNSKISNYKILIYKIKIIKAFLRVYYESFIYKIKTKNKEN